ncbi:MAG: efflux RND transporter permease subunit [Crocinitomicaceae bacterium]
MIIAILSLLTVFFGYKAVTGMQLDNRYGILLPNDAKEKIDYEKFKDLFGEDGGTLAIAIQTDSLYTESKLKAWKELGDSILKMDGVESVVSEATLVTITNNVEKQKFEAHRVFSDTSFQEKSVDSIKSEIRSNPFYKGLLYNDTSNVSMMMIAIAPDVFRDLKRSEVVLQMEDLARSYSDELGKPRFAGMPHMRVIVGKRIIEEMYIFIALLFLVTSALIYMFFRSIQVVLICNLIVAVAVTWSMGMIATLGYEMTIVMALIPPLMIVIAVPNCIFLLTKFHQEIREHGNKVLALSRVIKKIGTAIFLTNFTTSLGFLTFVTTNSDKLMEFGITASVNIILIYFISITTLPIVLSLSNPPKHKHLKHLERKLAVGLLDGLIHITVNHRKWVYIMTIAVLVFSFAGMMQIDASGNLSGDLPEDHPIKKDLYFFQDHFGGSIPFEVLITYKEPSRIAKKQTLEGVDQIQQILDADPLFAEQISYVDMLKAANMAYFNNDSSQYRLVTKKRTLSRLKRYMDSSLITNSTGVGAKMTELLDTANRILRIRTQMKDIGSYDVIQRRDSLYKQIDDILNPDKPAIERYYAEYKDSSRTEYVDSILLTYSNVTNALAESYITSEDERMEYYEDWEAFIGKYRKDKDFDANLRAAIDLEYYDVKLTGISIVASEGTNYLVFNLFTSLLFAILAISILMAILFRSARMVLISLIPNLIPLLFTAGVMGWTGIPLKPSTLLVFSIAFGISIDDTIHYLAKYRQELKTKKWDLKQCVLMAIREAGLGMFYTSIVLFCGFSMFMFSQFGGTQALGMLVSLTLLVAMVTNLVILPTLLLSLERRLITKSFEEPYFDAYAESMDIDWEHMDLEEDGPEQPETITE